MIRNRRWFLNIFSILALFSLTSFGACKEKKKGPMENKGIGPIKSVTLGKEVDTYMSDKGKEVFELKCTSCHKIGEKYVGPDLGGVTKRRSPEWIMNMMLNPEEMLEKDELAGSLLETYATKMVSQGLSEEEARSVFEYLREEDSKSE